jgi:hypothetical protein
MRVTFTQLASSVIKSMDYLAIDSDEWNLSETDGNLVVTFANGRTYEYLDVPFKTVLRVANGETRGSVGATFNLWVRNDYEVREIVEILA